MTSNPWLAGLPIAPKCPTCDARLLDGRCLECGPPIAEEEKQKNEQKRRREQSVQMDLFGKPLSERMLREQFAMLNAAPPPLELLIAAGQAVLVCARERGGPLQVWFDLVYSRFLLRALPNA